MKKTCRKCCKSLPLSQFYKQADRKDGHRSECKQCHSRQVSANFTPDKSRAYKARYHEADPRRRKANNWVNNHLRLGNIKRPGFCTECKKSCKPHAHHDDYDYPMSFRWLCAQCHKAWHEHNDVW